MGLPHKFMNLFLKITPYIPFWRSLNPGVKVAVLAMSPILEIRSAIPLGIYHYSLPIWKTYILAVCGNILILLPVMFFFRFLADSLIKKYKFIDKLFRPLFKKTRKEHSKNFKIYGALALILVVGIPLPGTGAWTGAIVAYIFGIPMHRSLPLISLGVAISGFIVLVFTVGFGFLF
jgi:uncharacterized membrane protein